VVAFLREHSPQQTLERATFRPEVVDGKPMVLLVEDEESYQQALQIGLSAEGFSVVGAMSLTEARGILKDKTPSLILLDVMLPDGSGIDFCREISENWHVPTIIVSAADSEVNVVLGLELGAADYVAKPYRLRELVARMRAVLRRPVTIASEPDVISFGDLRIDFARHAVTRNGEDIDLSRKEFELLALFANNLGQVVTREVCLDTLWWGLQLSDTRTLDTHVKRLRQKIETDPSSPRHLITVRGVGFRLDA
jgi:two-component system response regulator RegX3